ncbi:MAG: hypothetical protein L0229_26295 [Blastocatellia bacterium]|nr:hypothetical protein [Blastocatellia bacterium]
MNEHITESLPEYRCFRCQSGCIHVVCGNAMLTLTLWQFLNLVEAINIMHHQIQKESEVLALHSHSSASIM